MDRSNRLHPGHHHASPTEGVSGRRPPVRTGRATPSDTEVEARCRAFAEFLLELAREDRLEPALSVLLDALDEGMDGLDAAAHRRAEHAYDRIFEHHIEAQERRLLRQEVDPYFWG